MATFASADEKLSQEQKIAQLFIVGFYATSVQPSSAICKSLHKFNPGGVVLFDFSPVNKKQPKNITSKKQLKQLTTQLQQCSAQHNLLIAVDQEGGTVQRLKHKYGFYGHFPNAKKSAQMDPKKFYSTYVTMAQELHDVGINYNLAPIVDLDINKRNFIIHKLHRSFSKDPYVVAQKARLFIKAMHTQNVLTALKHFPGHGSSLGDTHKGFVNVTNLWTQKELIPYEQINNDADTIMVAHLYNKKLDPLYPATLSKKTIQHLLREQIGYNGVVITDDLLMGAIRKKYSLKRSIELALNAGNTLLLFANQVHPKHVINIETLVHITQELIDERKVQYSTIESAYKKIQKLKQKIVISIPHPIQH